MLFNSLEFLAFFVVVAFLYFVLPHRYRWALVAVASYYFYMSAKVEYGLLLFISTLMGYFGALWIEREDNHNRRKIALWLSIFANLSLLLFFKYANFISDNVRALARMVGVEYSPLMLKIILPIGISFYTFQAISYLIDVYNKKIPAERHFGIYSAYHAFFPQLVAGPIERGGHLLPQFHEKHFFDYKNLEEGLQLMIVGFFKKVVLADRLAIIVNQVYNHPTEYSAIPFILATICFAFQILFDFSAYTDIARGTARIMGFELVENFNRPYMALSILDFWKRWHISLSNWLKDYIYIPLGGNKVSKWMAFVNVMVVFFVSGMWHGANWNFIVWGLLHGSYIVFSRLTQSIRQLITKTIGVYKFPFIHEFVKRTITFTLVSFAWIFFRSNNFSESIVIMKVLLIDKWELNYQTLFLGGLGFEGMIIASLGMAVLYVFGKLNDSPHLKMFSQAQLKGFRNASYLLMIFFILLFGIFNKTQFIYFQF